MTITHHAAHLSLWLTREKLGGRCAAWCLALVLWSMSLGGRAAEVDADSLMQRVFVYADVVDAGGQTFEADLYTRHYLRTQRKGVVARYLPGMMRMEAGQHEYFGESIVRILRYGRSNVDGKVLATYHTMPYLKGPRTGWIDKYSFSIYSAVFFSSHTLSPFNRRNRRFYRYSYNFTYVDNGRRVVSVQIVPRVRNRQLASGSAHIDALSGEVRSFSLSFHQGWTHWSMSAEMGRDTATRNLPRTLSLRSNAKLLGNRINEQFDLSIAYKPLLPSGMKGGEKGADRYDLTAQRVIMLDTASINYQKAYFDAHRPLRLLPEQQAIYDADSLQRVQDELKGENNRRDGAKLQHEATRRAAEKLLDSYTFALGETGKLQLPPVLTPSMLQWSKSKGFSLQTQLKLKWAPTPNNRLTFAPRVGYSFKQQQVYWRLPLDVTMCPNVDGHFSVEASGGDHIYNSKQAEEVAMRMEGVTHYDSLLLRLQSHEFHYYRDNRVMAHFSFSPVVGLTIKAGVRYNHRALIHWNEVAQAAGMRRRLVNLAPRLCVEWTPQLYYYRDGKQRVPLYSQWPTFMIDYERSVPGIDAHTSYERIEVDAKYRFDFHALRSLYLRMGAGGYLQRSHNSFLNYENFKHHALPMGVTDEMSGQFQLLDARWYNESDYYVRCTAAYESPLMLLSRIKWLARLISCERVYCNLLSVRRLPIYSEWGYGLSLPLVDVGGFVSFAGKGRASLGCNVVFHWGE